MVMAKPHCASDASSRCAPMATPCAVGTSPSPIPAAPWIVVTNRVIDWPFIEKRPVNLIAATAMLTATWLFYPRVAGRRGWLYV